MQILKTSILKNGNYKLSETSLQNEFNATFSTNDGLSEIQIFQTDEQLIVSFRNSTRSARNEFLNEIALSFRRQRIDFAFEEI
ncbi:hypothetical protein LEP1GSC168_3780 [Leptospira santarosai str. HAI134]|nr:hypothetical protein [Leptospira santarosai]EKR90402.1 hypothetical protein LEP1GSC163_0509 [Leptospira santarosai str. CBC379]EMJ46345.1 hypothetical protein LEP1GSC169_2214 [Leptospira santarosai str. HAI1349]EMO20478.1 hypothetical protein LEP1GSC168_3780 [Leptospira santarosai str. HAI134]